MSRWTTPILPGGSREGTIVSVATETGIPDDAGKKILKWGSGIVVSLTAAACVIVGRTSGLVGLGAFAAVYWHLPVLAWLALWPAAGSVVMARMFSEIWYKNHPVHAQLRSSRLMGPFGWSKKEHDEYDKRNLQDLDDD